MKAYIHSKKILGESYEEEKQVEGDIKILTDNGTHGTCEVVESGVVCTFIRNAFNGRIYADDLYGIVK